MDELKNEIPEEEEAKEEWNQRVEDLESRIDKLDEDLEELSRESGEAWENMKEGSPPYYPRISASTRTWPASGFSFFF